MDFESQLYLADEALLRGALARLVDFGVLTGVEDRYGPLTYVVGGPSLRALGAAFPDSPFDRSTVFGPRWIKRALVAVTADEPSALSKDAHPTNALGGTVVDDGEIWEPLPIDRHMPQIEGALDQLKATVETVAHDNGFSASFPAERDNLVSHAKSTLASIADGKVTRFQVRHNIIGAGKWLTRQFGGTELGDLGSQLVRWGELLLSDVQ